MYDLPGFFDDIITSQPRTDDYEHYERDKNKTEWEVSTENLRRIKLIV